MQPPSPAAAALGGVIMDDETASDLELDAVFERIDRNLTASGRAALYALMRSTPMDIEEHERRQEKARFYRERPELRERARALLRKAGREEGKNAEAEPFAFTDPRLTKFAPLISVWVAFSLVSIALPLVFGPGAFLFIIMPVAIVNLTVFALTTTTVMIHAASLYHIGLMVGLCERLSRLSGAEGSEEIARLAALRPKLRRITRTTAILRPVSSFGTDIAEFFVMYVKIFLLGELYAYTRSAETLRNLDAELRELYATVGALDAYCSLALLSGEEGAPIRAIVKAGGGRIEAVDVVHPLLAGCVPVSLAAGRGIVLTGTNMSGKSTFLRTLGINQALATNLGLAFAASFETDLFFVMGSIRSEDDRAAGKSRYLAEAERLLGIFRSIRSGGLPVLALIDEILNGTNSEDRIAASIAILSGSAGRGSIVVAATHDLEIAYALKGAYDPYYFSERIEDGRLVFDYALREGVVDRKNALRLLRLIGFGDEILGPERDTTGPVL